MTVRGTALLVGLLAALLAYLWLGELRPRHGRATAKAVPTLLAAATADVTRIDLEEHGRRLVAIRRDGKWVDAQGHAWRGDVVGDLIDTLGTLSPIMVVDADPAEPSDYGLGPDTPRLRVMAAGKELLSLEIGERNPAWTGLYARLAGQREVILVGAVLHWELEKLRDAAPDDDKS
ncbi:MAG: DUF4340 domain-containing protein [Deltaproteobacteria bacterium]|nr:MAG: DUF4340 domain-containing protein [Deltaproteobacteria bacterium]